MEPVAVGIAVVVLLVLLRLVAARRVAARQGKFVWLMFLPSLIGGGVILWVGIGMLASAPFVGVATLVVGGLCFFFLLRFLGRTSRSVSAAGPTDDIGAAMDEPLVDYATSVMGLLLIVGLVAVVALIAWGVSQAAQ